MTEPIAIPTPLQTQPADAAVALAQPEQLPGATLFARPDAARQLYKLDLKLGFRCNNKCVFCVQGDKRDHVRDLTTEQAFARLDHGRQSCDALLLTGGEITVRSDVPEIISYARKIGYTQVQVQTNGRRLAYLNYCKALIDAGATEFNPSLHGHVPAMHDGLVGAKGAFDQCVRGITNLVALQQTVLTQSVITRQNVTYLPQIARLLVKLKVAQVQFAFVHGLGTAALTWNDTVPRYAQVARFLPVALDIVREAGISVICEAVPFCFLHGREWAAIEPRLHPTTVYDGNLEIGDYDRYRHEAGKLHGPPCARCTWAGVCEGPWREYPERFGWDEFTARTDAVPKAFGGTA